MWEEYEVCENIVIRKIFEFIKGEIIDELRYYLKSNLNKSRRSSDIVRIVKCTRIRWAGNVVRMKVIVDTYVTLVGKSPGKLPHGRPISRYNDNIKVVRMGSGLKWLRIVPNRGFQYSRH